MPFTEHLLSAVNLMAGTKKTIRPKGTRSLKKPVTRTVEHPQLGQVKLVVSRRARRIILTVKPDCTVRLSVPYGMPVENGMKFLELKKDWAAGIIAKYRSRVQPILPPYTTRTHELLLAENPEGKTVVKVSDCKISVSHPADTLPESDEVQRAIRKGICEAMRAEARELLPHRLEELSRQTGLKYGKVSIRNTVSKWGSCSARNDISLSLHLMRLPDYLIDYVLVHELCHTVHKNHGPRFHALLDKLTGGRDAQLRRELRTYHTRW